MTDLVRACALADVAPETAISVEVGGEELAIVHSGGRYYAIADECSHAAIPLSEGDVGDGEIECYLHGSRFDLATGKPLGLPATERVAVYRCRVVGDDLLVDASTPLDPDLPSDDLPPHHVDPEHEHVLQEAQES
ncbi:MAG TPA: non-heme iron oxygenase ferredoxin subunit [Propionibacteriaceae bacterium]|nr:non-heme iron oxygenase ferredoxin subunit [Propionibacteriaceae bacterium]